MENGKCDKSELSPSPHPPQSQSLSIYQHISGPDDLSLLRYSSLLCSDGTISGLGKCPKILPNKSFTGLGLDCFGSISHFRLVFCDHPNSIFPRGTELPSFPPRKRSQPIREEFEAQDAGHCSNEQIQRKVNGRKLNAGKGTVTILLSSF